MPVDPTGYVQAGAWCRIAHAMCATGDGGGGGFARESATYRVPGILAVRLPYVRATWGLVYGRGPFGDGGRLRFAPRFVCGWRRLAIPYVATGTVQVEGESRRTSRWHPGKPRLGAVAPRLPQRRPR